MNQEAYELLARIYALRDPIAQTTFYVGFTSSTIHKRMKQHISKRELVSGGPFRGEPTLKSLWIEELKQLGQQPKIVQLECFGARAWTKRLDLVGEEFEWIARFIRLGYPLLNSGFGRDSKAVENRLAWAEDHPERRLASIILQRHS